ncbi:hypothetical protein ACUUL3_08080 [Thiovibrio sp. JS02]
MSQPEKRAVKEKTSLPLIIGIAVLVGLGLLAGWYFFQTPTRGPVIEVAEQAPPPAVSESAPSIPEMASAPGQAAPVVATPTAEKPKDPCELISAEINAIFTSLDGRDYIAARKLKDGSHAHFSKVAEKLLATPPVISGETDSLYSILNNTAHFYRTLRKDDFFLLKEILEKESDSLEANLATFYRWTELAPKCDTTTILIRLPLPALYEYAGFFLHTLGGQSYLFRRESRLRLLVKYYSILILDRANDASLNRHGLDIRPSIDSLLTDMKTAGNLAGRDDYETKLILLQDKYLQQYGEKKSAAPSLR